MQNARLDELQAGIKTARRNINNLRYTQDNTLMAESEEEPQSRLIIKYHYRRITKYVRLQWLLLITLT